MEITKMQASHWPEIKRIYEQGIATGNATFETQVPSWNEWDKAHSPDVRLIATSDELVIGWAAISPVSVRPVYRGVAEVSVYVDTDFRGRGVGLALLNALANLSEVHGYWTLQAGIFPENVSSIKIHEKAGFRMVGYRERIGKMENSWRNTVLLERRSPVEVCKSDEWESN